jgi:protein TonB
MFESISVSERTRKPWTVLVSCAGQCVMIGLFVLIPLVTRQALPHGRLAGFLLPEPPAASPARRTAQARPPHAKPIPFQVDLSGLQEPRQIPRQVVLIDDPDFVPPAGSEIGGVPFGMGSASGSGNGVIDDIARTMPGPAPPAPSVARDPTPPAPRRITVVSRLQTAKLISGPRPLYPPLAKAARVSGQVHLRAVIARDGTILDLRVIGGHPLLIPAALAAVKQWVFQPTYLNGDPVEVATEIIVDFTLQQ